MNIQKIREVFLKIVISLLFFNIFYFTNTNIKQYFCYRDINTNDSLNYYRIYYN